MNSLPTGTTFSSSRDVPLSTLRLDLLRIARFLQDKVTSSQLIQYDDWWQHDGLHFDKKRISLSDLFAYLETNKTLHESVPDDFEVRVGISDERTSWYLRYIVDWDESEKDLEGSYDFSVPTEWVNQIRSMDFSEKPKESDSHELYHELIK